MTKFSLLHSLTETTLSALNLFALEKTQLPFSELVHIFQQQSTARVTTKHRKGDNKAPQG